MTEPSELQSRMPAGFYPFWFWNDRLSDVEIRWQIRQMAEQGVKGFYIHSRQGLGQPYMADAFLDRVATAVDEARAQGLTVHLYDEYPYPTGAAGGEAVLGNPQFRATELIQQEYDVTGGPLSLELPRGTVLAVRAYPVRQGQVDWPGRVDLRSAVGNVLTVDSYLETGLTTYNQKRYFASFPIPVLETILPAGQWRIFAAVQVEVTRHKYWGHFLDVLNPEAVREFLRLTDDRYARRFAAEFGSQILSIFTDETFPGWSALVPEKFRAACGYDLLDEIEALRDDIFPGAMKVRLDFRSLVYAMFIEAFERPLSEKRRALNLAYCGEKPSMRMSQLRFMDLPGCEPGHTKAGAPLDLLQARLRGNARATASAAYFYGKAGALDECYHSLGWSGTLQDAKLMVDGQLLLGIRYLVPHGFFYSTHGLRKHDAPPTFFFQAPYWPMFGKLSAYIDRLTQHFEGTHIAAEILLVEPAWGMPVHADLEAYLRLQNWLMAHHYDFMHVDTDILQSGRVGGGSVTLRDLEARVVIVPPMQALEPELKTWLEGFQAAGGKVIYFEQGADPTTLEAELAGRVKPGILLRASGDETAEAVWAVKRTSEEKSVWLLVNTSARNLDLEIDAGGDLHEISLQDGLEPALERSPDDRSPYGYRRELAPFESCLLAAGAVEESPPVARIGVLLDGPVETVLVTPNLLRIADWELSLLDEAGHPDGAARVKAAPIANQLAEGGLKFAPRFVQRFGLEPGMELPELKLRYDYSFDDQYSGEVDLVMEPGSIGGDWQLWVNEQGPFGPGDFAPAQAHVRGSLGLRISGMLVSGANRLRIEVHTARPDGGLLNPLYLAGDFGVIAAGLPALVERPRQGEFEDYTANGLPYFSGVLEYHLALDLPELPDGPRIALDLETSATFNDAAEISINGGDFQPVLWQPRRVELPASSLKVGRNPAVVRVYTTLIRAFEGQWFDEVEHRYHTI